jgi:hypothetical protein
MARNDFYKSTKLSFLLSLFLGGKNNQKRLLNFYKELASALSAVAEPLTNLRCVLWLYCSVVI